MRPFEALREGIWPVQLREELHAQAAKLFGLPARAAPPPVGLEEAAARLAMVRSLAEASLEARPCA